MRTSKVLFLSVFLMGAAASAAFAQAQAQDTTGRTQPQAGNSASASVTTVNQAIDRMIAREHDEIAAMRRYNPIVETYIQDMKPDPAMGAIPVRDHYFLGQADLSKGIVDRSMLNRRKGKLDQFNPISHPSGFFTSSYIPEGFLQMIYIDTNGFDRQHYQIDYVRREFLGEVRCLVFDFTPLPKSGKGRFKGRVWAEDQGYTIVRFNGVYTPVTGINGFNLHFDSWRLNVQPGLWLPAYIFSQESDLKDFLGNHVRFKSQTRLWGYNLKNVGRQEEFSELTIESPNAIQDQAAPQDRSPIEAQREWQHQAEINVVDRLERLGLVAPPGEVDKVLETVVNNLEDTNNLDLQPEVRCRVLLTSTLESFAIGHTIVFSRGLIDVLPDEASLATMVAHELAHVVLGHRIDEKYAFSDRLLFDEKDTFRHFGFARTKAEDEAANAKANELLRNSPYKDQLATAKLFLNAVQSRQKDIPNLISPHLGDRVPVNIA